MSILEHSGASRTVGPAPDDHADLDDEFGDDFEETLRQELIAAGIIADG
ncbi:hypothetical protein [Microbacterium hominis]|uniref:Uncharacterized protein n=1 Tax=Microbacterium hominis TaxID=162426 RepID=A0A7D4UAQ5_9MICO|nr:hypothetical protein [Microbacterium hominis]QKJ18743.1 hypothetical protein HQM25_04650 [Microbacterium hominis]